MSKPKIIRASEEECIVKSLYLASRTVQFANRLPA